MNKDKSARKRRTRRVAICAILSAMGVVILYLGALIDVLDLSVAVIASLLCVFAVIEMGGAWPWLIYAVVSVLSLVLLPQKSPAVVFALYAGYYPILKAYLERLPRVLSAVLKIAAFNLAFSALIFAMKYLLALPDSGAEFSLLVYALGNLTFILYDIALTRVISAYFRVFRARLHIKNI